MERADPRTEPHRRISVGPRDVLRLKKPTRGFLCPPSGNEDYGLNFLWYSVRDDESKRVFLEVGNGEPTVGRMELDAAVSGDDCFRSVKYTFGEDILRLPNISTSLTFKVGDQPISNLRMIERHYFKNELLKSYDFTFGFCIPGSVNTWEAIYNVPPLKEEDVRDMIAHPFEAVSDTFFFVGKELILHNKARYRYEANRTRSGPLDLEKRWLTENVRSSPVQEYG